MVRTHQYNTSFLFVLDALLKYTSRNLKIVANISHTIYTTKITDIEIMTTTKYK